VGLGACHWAGQQLLFRFYQLFQDVIVRLQLKKKSIRRRNEKEIRYQRVER
jgi:hypothetical protein